MNVLRVAVLVVVVTVFLGALQSSRVRMPGVPPPALPSLLAAAETSGESQRASARGSEPRVESQSVTEGAPAAGRTGLPGSGALGGTLSGPAREWLAAVEADPAEGERRFRARYEALARLVESDPEAALEEAWSEDELARVPAAYREWLERRVSGQGHLDVLCAYPEPGREGSIPPVIRYVSLGGERYRAFVHGEGLLQGTRQDVWLEGVVVAGRMAVENRWEAVAEEPVMQGALPARAAASASGESTPVLKRLIFIRVDFSDLAGESISSNRAVLLARELHRFFMENSFGRTGFAEIGQGSVVTPVFRMPRTASSYGSNDDAGDLRADARAAARAAGYVNADYDYDVTFLGSVPGFGWAGLGVVNGMGAWVRGTTSTGVTAHELGHNFGLNHANFWDTGGASAAGPGSSIEYGDKFDTMGAANAGRYHFNARYKRLLGWLEPGEYSVVTTNGVYRVYAHDQTNHVAGSRGLQVFANARTNYWIEVRQQFTTLPAMMNGVGVRWTGRSRESSLLLDTTPGSTGEKDDDALLVGRTYSDFRAGVHITPLRRASGPPAWADVAVYRGEFRDNRVPSVTLIAGATTTFVSTPLDLVVEAADSDGDELAYSWDFGDGTMTTNSARVSHAWNAVGEYRVVVAVSDLRGGVGYAAVVVRVGSPTTFRVAGRVTVDGEPAAGVRVTGSQGRRTETDSEGRYELVGLSRGSYSLAATDADGTRFAAVGFVNPVTVSSDRAGLDFALADTTGQQVVTLLPSGASWKYWDRGSVPSDRWTEAAFDDAGWDTGAAILGYGGDRETSVIGFGPDASSKYVTSWFRKTFEVRDPAGLQRVTLSLLRDDGAVVYLNGSELLRDNMPAGNVTASTLASGTVSGTGETTYREFDVDPTQLRAGTNLFAVEVHQVSRGSSDTAFDLRLTAETSAVGAGEIRLTRPAAGEVFASPASVVLRAMAGTSAGVLPGVVRFFADGVEVAEVRAAPYVARWNGALPGEHVVEAVAEWADGRTAASGGVSVVVTHPELAPVLIPRRSVWRYLDSGLEPASDWAGVGFDDSGWRQGPGRLGYGEDGEATVLDWGIDPSNRPITTWFRRDFAVHGVETVSNLVVRVQRDDGVVVYLNGAELFRTGLRSGALTPSILASTDVRDDAEQAVLERVVSAAGLVEGRNVVAVELHQSSAASSDLGFDLELEARRSRVPEVLELRVVAEPAGGIVLSWPAGATPWTLQSADTLGAESGWQDVSVSASPTAGRWEVRIGSDQGERYFRLIRRGATRLTLP